MNKEFAVHFLNERGKRKAGLIAKAFDECLDSVLKLARPPQGLNNTNGRELAIVRTKLEEACFFAKKAMANAGGNCEDDNHVRPTPSLRDEDDRCG